jgi:hypothetical protein
MAVQQLTRRALKAVWQHVRLCLVWTGNIRTLPNGSLDG